MADELKIIGVYTAYRNYLNHEHNLINHRLSWNCMIQGFLFTSYAFVLNKSADVRQALSQSTTVHADLLRAPLHDLQVLLFILGAVGIMVSYFIDYSIRGARKAMNGLITDWSTKTTEGQSLTDAAAAIGLPRITGGGDPKATEMGVRAPAFLSIVFILGWAILLADELLGHVVRLPGQ